jgi:hypothetical protein
MTVNASNIIVWEGRLTRLSFALLVAATAYGIVVGAAITMYYDITPNMGALEDRLSSVQATLYLFAIFVSFYHLPMVFLDIKHNLLKQAFVRGAVSIGPLFIFLGTDGLISHLLWWLPISETDRFHMLHHSTFAGAPLILGYWFIVQRWWRPDTFKTVASPSPKTWLVSGILIVWIVMGAGILFGFVSPILFGGVTVIGLITIPFAWRMIG